MTEEEKKAACPEDYYIDYFFDFTIEVCGDRLTIWREDDIIDTIHRSDRAAAIRILTSLYERAAKHKRKKHKKQLKSAKKDT